MNYIAFSNEEIKNLPPAGDRIQCVCGKTHKLIPGTCNGEKDYTLMFYKCNGSIYLGSIQGKLVSLRKNKPLTRDK